MKRCVYYCLALATVLTTTTVSAQGPHISRESIEWCSTWIPDANGSKLPRVLLIGDSITVGYGPKVADALKDKVIWATITPMRTRENLAVFAEGTKRVEARNQIAEGIVAKEGIAVDDLYGLVKDHPEYGSKDGVHFNSKGIAAQAEQVTKRILESIK